MVRTSLYLALTYGVQGGLGFIFWLIVAKYFSSDNVGRASSLISATTLIGFVGLLGLNTTFVRYLPTVRQRNSLITAGLTLVAASAGGLALIYVLLTPLIAPSLSFIAHSLPFAAGFILLTAAGSVNILTDAVFIAAGKARFSAITDGLVGGITKIFLVIALLGSSAYGIFCASTAGFLTAAVASLVLMMRGLRWRPQLENFVKVLKPVLTFSGANYAANLLNLVPSLVVPLIILDRMGPSPAGYYYVAYQLAALLYQTVYAVEQSFLAQGAHNGVITRSFLLRSVRILAALCGPCLILVLLLGHQILSLFGAKYSQNAAGCFVVLSVSVVPIAINNWLLTVLRLSNQLKAIVVSNTVYAAAVCGVTWVLTPHGLTAVSLAWPVGITAGSVIAGIAAVRTMRRQHPVAHPSYHRQPQYMRYYPRDHRVNEGTRNVPRRPPG